MTIQKQLGRLLRWSFCHHHSFIHSENLYSAPSRNFRYLRGYYLPKRIVLKRMYRAMHNSQTSPWNQELILCSEAKYPTRCGGRGHTSKMKHSQERNAKPKQLCARPMISVGI